jgi:hypothetical protein
MGIIGGAPFAKKKIEAGRVYMGETGEQPAFLVPLTLCRQSTFLSH